MPVNTGNLAFPGFTILYRGPVPDFNKILNVENYFRLLCFSDYPQLLRKKLSENTGKLNNIEGMNIIGCL
jgi:hypothetical protein